MDTVFPYQGQIDFSAYLDRYLQREDAIRRIPTEAELKELARKAVVKDRLELAAVPAGEAARTGDTLTLRTVSQLPKFNRERVTVSVGRGLYDKDLEAALIGKTVGESCQVVVKGQPVTASILEIRRKTAPAPTDEMVEALQEKDYQGNVLRTYEAYERFICEGKITEALANINYYMMEAILEDYPITEYSENDIRALGELEREMFRKLYRKEKGVDVDALTREQAQELFHCDSMGDFIAMRRQWYQMKIHQCLIYLDLLSLPCAGATDPLDHYEVLSELQTKMFDKIRDELTRRNAQ